jgi:hypothetical protein
MTIPAALHHAMETLDDHAERIGSGPYASLAAELQTVANSMKKQVAEARRAFAIEVLLDVPSCALSESMAKFTGEHKFMCALVRKKGLQLRGYRPHCGAIMGTAWKIEITDALLPYDGPISLEAVRNGIMILLVARSGFLPQIVNRLARLAISPMMLCPSDFEEKPVDGDDGDGPSAEDFFFYEPRMLRWLLGHGEDQRWPLLESRSGRRQPEYVRRLILLANSEGGDDKRVNEACTCKVCKGVRIPTIDCPMTSSTLSTLPETSECGSEVEDEMVL